MTRRRPISALAALSSVGMPKVTSAHAAAFKTIRFLRHGQAMHNVNAERMRESGCSYEAFIQAMKDDDHFDSPLTALGRSQAADTAALPACRAVGATVDLVVSSTLSRAIDTADLTFPVNRTQGRRLCTDSVREILGMLLNGKRRLKSELAALYPHWDFEAVESEEDVLWEAWGDELEGADATKMRAHACLEWLWYREEQDIALVGHGGIFSLLTNDHAFVECGAGVGARFANCELRSCRLELAPAVDEASAAQGPEEPLRFRLSLLDESSSADEPTLKAC
jgi:broad specificity phosphatase PhoE